MHFPAECGRECVKWLKSEAARWSAGGGGLRVLDVGCAVGRSSFEAARYASDVLGIDFSHSFIAAANQLKQVNHTAPPPPLPLHTDDDCAVKARYG